MRNPSRITKPQKGNTHKQIEGLKQMSNYVVITEIYCEGEKVSRKRREKVKLDNYERNQLIQTIFINLKSQGKYYLMDIYSMLVTELEEKHGIRISERQAMRMLKKD